MWNVLLCDVLKTQHICLRTATLHLISKSSILKVPEETLALFSAERKSRADVRAFPTLTVQPTVETSSTTVQRETRRPVTASPARQSFPTLRVTGVAAFDRTSVSSAARASVSLSALGNMHSPTNRTVPFSWHGCFPNKYYLFQI